MWLSGMLAGAELGALLCDMLGAGLEKFGAGLGACGGGGGGGAGLGAAAGGGLGGGALGALPAS